MVSQPKGKISTDTVQINMQSSGMIHAPGAAARLRELAPDRRLRKRTKEVQA